MTLAFGGNSVLYFSLPAFFKACEEFNLKFDEIHCVGFSCIPVYYYLKTGSSNQSYVLSKNLYEDAIKTFHFANGFNFTNVIEQIRALYKASKTLAGFKSQKVLVKFVEKYFPDEKIDKKLKIHAFNLNTFNDEILQDNLREAIIKTLTLPLEFAPYNGYVSGAWVYGIPEADFLLIIQKTFDVSLNNAVDFMVYSTYARTQKIINQRINNAKYKIKISTKNSNPFNLSTKLYEISKKYIGGII
ncbi:MAG: hypothetical protein H0Z24_08240 [Thermosipho sp. (in: Bacteria)]|nr:hypothetical protein [Thermosipho sp. (in: thermotogales)]